MELKFILESLLFSAQKPLSVKELRDVLADAAGAEDAGATAKSLAKIKESELTAALEQLAPEHEAAGRSYRPSPPSPLAPGAAPDRGRS